MNKGNNVPIWRLEAIRARLNIEKFDKLIGYLSDLCLVKSISDLENTFIVPLYLLNEKISANQLKSLWPEQWCGHEIKTKLTVTQINCPIISKILIISFFF